MNWLRRIVGRVARADVDERRWVVLDVEASGLDAARDRLLAIAAVAVHLVDDRASIALGDSFQLVLRQPEERAQPDKVNILLHGIGVAEQRAGVEPLQALDAFTSFVGRSPLLGFHVAFDRTLIERACAELGRPPLSTPWLDIEPLAAALLPQARARALDDWLAHLNVPCLKRHDAGADALATAELLLHLWPQLRRERATRFGAATALASRRRWLGSG